ncbi:unnamed protein product [Miscanthus lutarioriparius]|uniref:Uncharacterized protein n=1 Tax=Miscanthus lutarioriparius TaxID=422564 RepID=A0A811QD85_9POAL|nr:unnamed protein product [Miscanthus lutarioriparius]
MDLKAVGPGCTALHAHYMKDCVNNKHGIVVRFRGIYMLNSSNFEVGLVRYNFLYDLFQFGALDASLLQCWILSLVVEAKAKDIHVGFLDPQVMSLDSITFDRDKVLQAFARHTNKLKDRPQPLKHAFKYACLQQSSAKSSGWYAAHHLFLAMRKTNLEYSEHSDIVWPLSQWPVCVSI